MADDPYAAYRAQMAALGRPLPWRLCDEEVGVVLAADGSDACTVDVRHHLTDEQATEIATWIMTAVNTCGGYKAELTRDA